MPRVRWADLGLEDAAAAAAGGEQPPHAHNQQQQQQQDAWGADEEEEQGPGADEGGVQHQPTRTVSQAQQTALAALLTAAHRQPLQQQQQQQEQQRPKHLRPSSQQQMQSSRQQQNQQPQLEKHQVPSLHKLCMGILGQHCVALVEQLGNQLQWLPPDARAALLAVARRRGEVFGELLSSFADDSWTQLDLAGCSRLYGAEILAAAPRMPKLTALDVTGCERISAGGWRQLAQAWPQLQVIRLGGSAVCSEEALKALPHILPGIPPPPHKAAAAAACSRQQQAEAAVPAPAAAAAASWEDAFASSDSEDEDEAGCSTRSSCSGSEQQHQWSTASGSKGAAAAGGGSVTASGRLKHLQALIWPDVPSAAVELVQQRCPRVLINPELKPHKLTGELPPRAWDAAVPLDEPCMQMVTAAALEEAGADAVAAMAGAAGHGKQQQEPVVHIADRFKQAYIDRAKRLKEKERRLQAAEERKQLKSSHALRTLNAWLDERE